MENREDIKELLMQAAERFPEGVCYWHYWEPRHLPADEATEDGYMIDGNQGHAGAAKGATLYEALQKLLDRNL